MTRINANIDPKWLADEHLLAEHREISRLPNLAAKSLNDPLFGSKTFPDHFTLGPGHVTFFYYKYHFTNSRYNRLYNECKRRGMKVECYDSSWYQVWYKALVDTGRWFTALKVHSMYEPTMKDNIIVLARIIHNVSKSNKKTYHMNHKRISKDEYLEHLMNCLIEIQNKDEKVQ